MKPIEKATELLAQLTPDKLELAIEILNFIKNIKEETPTEEEKKNIEIGLKQLAQGKGVKFDDIF